MEDEELEEMLELELWLKDIKRAVEFFESKPENTPTTDDAGFHH